MSGAIRSGWIVATSIGAVEALKDQLGVCRWNYGFRLLQKNAKKGVQSYHQSSSKPDGQNMGSGKENRKNNQTETREQRMKKVMGLSSWGPSTVRF